MTSQLAATHLQDSRPRKDGAWWRHNLQVHHQQCYFTLRQKHLHTFGSIPKSICKYTLRFRQLADSINLRMVWALGRACKVKRHVGLELAEARVFALLAAGPWLQGAKGACLASYVSSGAAPADASPTHLQRLAPHPRDIQRQTRLQKALPDLRSAALTATGPYDSQGRC